MVDDAAANPDAAALVAPSERPPSSIPSDWGELQSHTVVRALADLPGDAIIDAKALGEILNRCRRTVQRAVRREELPAPMTMLGKHVWLVKTIRDHFERLQQKALKEVARRQQRRDHKAF